MKKQKIIGFIILSLAAALIAYSCQPLGNIGEKPALEGSVSIIPDSAIKPGDMVMADISGIKYEVKPRNYQWYCSGEAIEGASEMAWTIPSGEYIGKSIYVEVSDPDFSGSLASAPAKVEAPEPAEPGYILGEVLLTQAGGASGINFAADISKVDFSASEDPGSLIPIYTWYVDTTEKSSGAVNTFSLDPGQLEPGQNYTIRVEVTASPLKGAVYASNVYSKPQEPIPGFISGLAFLTEKGSALSTSFEVDTDGLKYGAEGNPDNLTPSYTWYVSAENGTFGDPVSGETGNSLPLTDAYLDRNIRVKITAPPLNGAVYAQRMYSKKTKLFISGEVTLSMPAGTNDFKADISKIYFGTDDMGVVPSGHTPIYTWFIDHTGDGNFTEIPEPETTGLGDTIRLKDEYLDSNIRVMVSAPPLLGAVYAQKLVDKPGPDSPLVGSDAPPQILSEYIEKDGIGVWHYGTADGGIAACFDWLNSTGQTYMMNGDLAPATKLAGRVFRIAPEDDATIGGQLLGAATEAGYTLYTGYENIKGTSGSLVSITIRGNPVAVQGHTADYNGTVDIQLDGANNKYASLFKLAAGSFISLTLEGKLTLKGRSNSGNYRLSNKAALVFVGADTRLSMNSGVLISGNGNFHDSSVGSGKNGSRGGGVFIDQGTFIMEGGTISGNRARTGGGVYMTGDGATFVMNSGTISGNTAKYNGSGSGEYGGGVYMADAGCKFYMNGGTITGNTAAGKADGTYTYGDLHKAGGTVIWTSGTINSHWPTTDTDPTLQPTGGEPQYPW
jgi:hypothetical protein